MIIGILQTLVTVYLAVLVLMYLMQRSLLYFPVPSPLKYGERQVTFDNQGQSLSGWVLNPGKEHAIIYFGGNAESIEQNTRQFKQALPQYSIYLVPYRGYGNNLGEPTEQGLFSDALHIYDQIQSQHQTISAMGRSLGSGVASYIAANRTIDKLVLITPYDSIARVAQGHYPILPVSFLVKDKYESFKLADKISAKTLVFIAGQDVVVPPEHAHKLIEHLTNTQVEQLTIDQAGHNDISDYPQYQQTLTRFMTR
jgi:pimeloyl-ACP methyl ester carboxylesterase